jgi:hypothetical protein
VPTHPPATSHGCPVQEILCRGHNGRIDARGGALMAGGVSISADDVDMDGAAQITLLGLNSLTLKVRAPP